MRGGVFGGGEVRKQCVIRTSVGRELWDDARTHVQGSERCTHKTMVHKPSYRLNKRDSSRIQGDLFIIYNKAV